MVKVANTEQLNSHENTATHDNLRSNTNDQQKQLPSMDEIPDMDANTVCVEESKENDGTNDDEEDDTQWERVEGRLRRGQKGSVDNGTESQYKRVFVRWLLSSQLKCALYSYFIAVLMDASSVHTRNMRDCLLGGFK